MDWPRMDQDGSKGFRPFVRELMTHSLLRFTVMARKTRVLEENGLVDSILSEGVALE